MTSKPTPDEVLAGIEQSAIDDVLAMTPEERDRMLKDEGVDVRGLEAKADALYGAAHTKEHPRTGRSFGMFAGGIAFAAGVLLVLTWTRTLDVTLSPRVPSTAATTASTASPTPADLERLEAYGDLVEGHYEECLRKLDDAKRLDPPGDETERVKRAREQAHAGLAGQR